MATETEEKIDIGAELLALSDTKTKIAEAITAKGVETSKDDKFSLYPEKIQQIQSGSGDGGFKTSICISAKNYGVNIVNGFKTSICISAKNYGVNIVNSNSFLTACSGEIVEEKEN